MIGQDVITFGSFKKVDLTGVMKNQDIGLDTLKKMLKNTLENRVLGALADQVIALD